MKHTESIVICVNIYSPFVVIISIHTKQHKAAIFTRGGCLISDTHPVCCLFNSSFTLTTYTCGFLAELKSFDNHRSKRHIGSRWMCSMEPSVWLRHWLKRVLLLTGKPPASVRLCLLPRLQSKQPFIIKMYSLWRSCSGIKQQPWLHPQQIRITEWMSISCFSPLNG